MLLSTLEPVLDKKLLIFYERERKMTNKTYFFILLFILLFVTGCSQNTTLSSNNISNPNTVPVEERRARIDVLTDIYEGGYEPSATAKGLESVGIEFIEETVSDALASDEEHVWLEVTGITIDEIHELYPEEEYEPFSSEFIVAAKTGYIGSLAKIRFAYIIANDKGNAFYISQESYTADSTLGNLLHYSGKDFLSDLKDLNLGLESARVREDPRNWAVQLKENGDEKYFDFFTTTGEKASTHEISTLDPIFIQHMAIDFSEDNTEESILVSGYLTPNQNNTYNALLMIENPDEVVIFTGI